MEQIRIMGTCDKGKSTITQALIASINKEVVKSIECAHGKHRLINAKDATGDKICVSCRKRAEQAYLHMR